MRKTFVVLCCLVLWAVPCLAQDASELDPGDAQMAAELSNEIFSPFCPGKTLAMCPSPDAARVRRQIQQLATDGRTKDEIKEVIIEEYGEEFRLVEPPTGDNVGLLAGLGGGLVLAIVAVLFLSRKRDDGSDDGASEEPDEAEETEPDDDGDYLKELRDEYRS